MFRDTRRKRLRNRVLYAALGVTVMTFGIWLNYHGEEQEEDVQNAVQEVAVEESSKAVKQTDQREDDRKASDAEGTDTEYIPETYLIKEVEGVVKVFLRNEEGKEELYLITTIPFELLSESDQQLFTEGVELDTEEDLGKFLENFDS